MILKLQNVVVVGWGGAILYRKLVFGLPFTLTDKIIGNMYGNITLQIRPISFPT